MYAFAASTVLRCRCSFKQMFQISQERPLKATCDISTVFLKQTDNNTSCQTKILIMQYRKMSLL